MTAALEPYTTADGRSVEEIGPFRDTPGEVRPIGVNTVPDNRALMVVASKSHRDRATDDYIGQYGVRDMTSAGSSLKFCLVATGEAASRDLDWQMRHSLEDTVASAWRARSSARSRTW